MQVLWNHQWKYKQFIWSWTASIGIKKKILKYCITTQNCTINSWALLHVSATQNTESTITLIIDLQQTSDPLSIYYSKPLIRAIKRIVH